MEIEKWIGGYKVRSFPWINGKHIYFNVQYYAPGQAISKSPVWDKTVYITENEAGRNLVNNFTDSLIEYVASMSIVDNTQVVITA